jgi:hypothetical protein
MSLGAWVDTALHRYYIEVRDMQTLVKRATPLLDSISKSTQLDGSETGLFFTLAGGMGIAGDLTSAQTVADQGASSTSQTPGAVAHSGEWLLNTGTIETSLRLKYKNLVRGKSNKGAYLRNLVHETEQHGEAFGERLATLILRNGGYSVARITITDASAGICTVTDDDGNVDSSAIANIHKGMMLVASVNNGHDTSHTLITDGTNSGVAFVNSVNRDAGTFITSMASTEGTALTDFGTNGDSDNDQVFVFPLGQFRPSLAGTTLDDKLLIQTLDDWISPSVTGTSWGNVPRSSDSALEGVRVPFTGTRASMPIEQKLQFAAVYMQSRYAGTKPLTFVLQSEQWFELARSLQAQGIIANLGEMLKTGTRKVQIMTVNGMADVIAEPHQDPRFFYGLCTEDIDIRHLDGLPGVANADGLEMLRKADSNDLEFRLIAFPQLAIREPWKHCRGSLLAA